MSTRITMNPLAALLLAHQLAIVEQEWPDDDEADSPETPEPEDS